MSSSYGRHDKFQSEVLLYLSANYKQGRFWVNATGMAYTIPAVKNLMKSACTLNIGLIKKAIKELRPIKYGLKGSTDIIGCLNGRFIGIEIKTGSGKRSKEQENFYNMINSKNGMCLLVSNRFPINEQLKELDKNIN